MSNFNPQKYGELLQEVLPTVIKTEEENEQMLSWIENIVRKGEEDISPEEMRLVELMSLLVEEFETKAYSTKKGEPHEILRFLIEENELKQKALLPVFGSEGNISEVLKGNRGISAKHAKMLGDFFSVSPELFI